MSAVAYGVVTDARDRTVGGAEQIFSSSDQVLTAARSSTVFVALARRRHGKALAKAITQCGLAGRSGTVSILMTDGPIDGINPGNFATLYSNFDSPHEELKSFGTLLMMIQRRDINVDPDRLRRVFKAGLKAWISYGMGTGPLRARQAIFQAARHVKESGVRLDDIQEVTSFIFSKHHSLAELKEVLLTINALTGHIPKSAIHSKADLGIDGELLETLTLAIVSQRED